MTKRSPDMIVQLLQSKDVVTFEDMQNTLGTASRATTFRYLKQVQYMRSYNHNGRYYTFRDPTRFDRLGLYSYGGIYFSRDGKLGNTVIRLVRESETGMTQRELQNQLKVRVQVLLLEAVRQDKIRRELVEGFYLYLHNDPTIGNTQLKSRLDRIASHRIPQISVKVDEHIIIEVLLILIRQPSCRPVEVARALRGHVPPITTEQVIEVFFRYDLEEIGKKKGTTVS
ncbi:MAG: hypothetical protein MUO40_04235 [Anaerolineaceae bacterium]|nr:hypothetical protein [Anaerolineaceae bacterium]